MPEPVKRKVYTGHYLAHARHMVRLFVELSKYDVGLEPTNRYYAEGIAAYAQKAINRAEALADAYIFKDGSTEPPIPSIT